MLIICIIDVILMLNTGYKPKYISCMVGWFLVVKMIYDKNKIYTRVNNFLYLRKMLKNEVEFENFSECVNTIFECNNNLYEHTFRFERDLAAAVIKKYRNKYPYQIKNGKM